jgi:prephenate dehydrogenase
MIRTVVISGVGLIGGSFALALRESGFDGRIIGVGREETIRKALAMTAIDEGTQDLAAAARRADLVYLSHSVTRILDDLGTLSDHVRPQTLITDAGSTKIEIMAEAANLRNGVFIGGHPMAGKAVRGVENAEAGLFRGRPYFLCHSGQPQLQELVEIVHRIGAIPIEITAQEHDPLLAKISHLPQLISTALAVTLSGLTDPARVEQTAGPGLRGMLRLAGSSYEDIWEDILKTNPTEIEKALDAYIGILTEMRQELLKPSLEKKFAAAQKFTNRINGK